MARKRRERRQSQEIVSVSEAWGDYVDPTGFLNDDPSWRLGVSIGSWSDRDQGRNAPAFSTEQELARHRSNARILADLSTTAQGVKRGLLNFVIGPGFTYDVVPVAGMEPPQALVAAAKQIILRFLDQNDWPCDREGEFYWRGIRDGETFLGEFAGDGGDVAVREIEPEYITAPPNERDAEAEAGADEPSSWTFGVHTRAEDVQDVRGYWCHWNGRSEQYEYLPVENGTGDCWGVVHYKRNVDRNVKRGLTDFYCALERIGDLDKSIRNISKAIAVLSAIAMIKEYPPAASKSQIEAIRSANTYRTRTVSGPGGSKTINEEIYGPGTVVHTKAGQTYKAGPLATAGVGDSFSKLEQAVYRTLGVVWSMPEYLVSGDASNANYSSAMVAESPWVKFCIREQALLRTQWLRMLWNVLKIAHGAGRFRRFGVSYEDLEMLLNVVVRPPRVEARDHSKETAISQILWGVGGKSLRTWMTEEGYDFEQEKRNGAEPQNRDIQTLGAQGQDATNPNAAPFKDAGAQAVKDKAAAQPNPVEAAPAQPSGDANAQAASRQNVQVAQDLVLNGAQITAATAIVTAVTAGDIPRDAGLGQLTILFNLAPQQAEKIMGSAGTATPTTPNPNPAAKPEPQPTQESANLRLLAAAQRWEGYP